VEGGLWKEGGLTGSTSAQARKAGRVPLAVGFSNEVLGPGVLPVCLFYCLRYLRLLVPRATVTVPSRCVLSESESRDSDPLAPSPSRGSAFDLLQVRSLAAGFHWQRISLAERT
jgi:hypothetical protein